MVLRQRGVHTHEAVPAAEGDGRSDACGSLLVDIRANGGSTRCSHAPLVMGQSEGRLPHAAKFPSACVLQPASPPQMGHRRQTETLIHSKSAARP
jgi:hypothetical protein